MRWRVDLPCLVEVYGGVNIKWNMMCLLEVRVEAYGGSAVVGNDGFALMRMFCRYV